MMSHAIPLPRVSGSVALAGIITASLFWLMQDLIRHEGPIPDLVATGPRISIVRIPEPEEVIPEKPRERTKVVPPPVVRIEPVVGIIDGGIGQELVDAPVVDPGFTVANRGLPDGDMLPIVKVAPSYPARAANRGIEGYVLLEFTVDQTGAVQEPRVLEASPQGVFDRSALSAVLRFKYKPRVLNGTPVRVEGVLHRLTFELSGA